MDNIESLNQEAEPVTSRTRLTLKEQWGKLIALVSLVAIALGSFNDSMDALEKIYDFSLSQFTDIPSQDKLSQIYIRGSSGVLDETFGAPIYIKRSSAGDTIKYYRDDRFILSAVVKDEAIAAYLVFPLAGFAPDTSLSAGGEQLLNRPFSAQENVTDLRASLSRSISYYVEENTDGVFGNLYTSISGFSEFEQELAPQQRTLLTRLVDNLMLGEGIVEAAQDLRENFTPNFYGYNRLSLVDIEDAILTKSEFRLIQP